MIHIKNIEDHMLQYMKIKIQQNQNYFGMDLIGYHKYIQ